MNRENKGVEITKQMEILELMLNLTFLMAKESVNLKLDQ